MTWNPHKDREYQAALKRSEKNRIRNASWVREAREMLLRPFSRRKFLLGGTAVVGTLACTTAFANTPFTTFGYPVTGGVNPRNTPDRFADVLNVKEFDSSGTNSMGNGTRDDRADIQACFNTAYGMSQFTGSITTGGVLTVTNFVGAPLSVGSVIIGISIFNARRGTVNTVFPKIGSFGSGSGGNGTYNLLDENNANAPLAIDTAITTQPMGTSRGGGQTYNNKIIWFPAGNYKILSPLYLIGIQGGKIYGAGANNTQIMYQGNGTEGNFISTDAPQACPAFLGDGVSYFTIEGMGFVGDSQVIPLSMTAVTSNSTASGNNTLNFSQGTTNCGVVSDGNLATPQVGMGVFNLTDPTGNSIGGVTVASVPPGGTTVVLSGNVGTNSVASGARIVFTTPIIGIYQYQSGYAGTSTTWTVSDCNFGDLSIGFLGGASNGNCEQNVFFKCVFTRCSLSGLRTVNGNTLNWGVYGGGAGNCAHASTYDPARVAGGGTNLGAAYSCPAGSISVIYNISCTGNTWDIINAGAGGMDILGGSVEGAGIAPWVTTFSSASISGTTLTATIKNGALVPGSLIVGSGMPSGFTWVVSGSGPWTISQTATGATGLVSPGIFVNQSVGGLSGATNISQIGFRGGGQPGFGTTGLPEAFRALDCTFGGTIIANGYIIASTSVNTLGYMAALGNNGLIDASGTQLTTAQFGDFIGIKGGSGSRAYLRALNLEGFSLGASFFTNFTGKVMEFSTQGLSGQVSDFTVATLPTANAIWDRCRLTVTDYNAAWTSTIIGQTVTGHGGGTHVVPVICPDGAGWVVAG